MLKLQKLTKCYRGNGFKTMFVNQARGLRNLRICLSIDQFIYYWFSKNEKERHVICQQGQNTAGVIRKKKKKRLNVALANSNLTQMRVAERT